MAAKIKQGKGVGSAEEQQGPGSGIARLKQFISEVRHEFTKVVWPGKRQTVLSTTVVVALVVVVALYLGAVDLILGKIVGAILR